MVLLSNHICHNIRKCKEGCWAYFLKSYLKNFHGNVIRIKISYIWQFKSCLNFYFYIVHILVHIYIYLYLT